MNCVCGGAHMHTHIYVCVCVCTHAGVQEKQLTHLFLLPSSSAVGSLQVLLVLLLQLFLLCLELPLYIPPSMHRERQQHATG